MKNILIILLCLIGYVGYGQVTYNPIQHIPTNKAIGVSQAAPVDARSMFFDGVNFVYRPYVNMAEVLSYLNLSKYRVGNFDIIVNVGGTLNPNGTFSGGVNYCYWFKDGTADGNLVLKYPFIGTNTQLMLGDGTLGSVDTGLALSGNTLSIPSTGVIAGPYGPFASFQVNIRGQIQAGTNGSLINYGSGLTTGRLNQSIGSPGTTTLFLNNLHDTTYISWGKRADSSLYPLLDTAGLRAAIGGGSGNTNSNIGSGYRWAVPGTNNVKTVFNTALAGILIDSTTNTNGLTLKVDSSVFATKSYIASLQQDTLANPIGFADSILMHPSTHRFLLRALVAGSLTNITPTDTTLTIGLANNTANTLLGFNGSGVPSDITLTTTGSSGPATISGGVLNIPQYSGGSVTSVTQSTDTLKYNNGSDHVVNINRNFLGSIYNKNTWSNLSDFNVNGAFAFIVSNKIHFSGGAGNYSHILELTSPYTGVNIERWKMVMKIKVDTVNGSTFGAGCGMNSINGYGKNSVVGRTSLTSTPSSNGQAMLDNASNGTSFVNLNTSDVSTNIPIAAGDYVYVIVERNINVITVSVKDITTNSRYNFTSYSYPSNTTPYVPNTGRFSLWDFGGGWTLDSLAITSTAEKFVENAAVGDSKTQCFNASSFNLRWSSLLNQYVPTITLAGGFDRTAEVLLDIPLIIALHPKQVILSIGSNDVRSGVSTATYLANYDTITNRLTAAGITVYHTVNWESSVDLTTLWTHVTATYPNNYIDTWYPLQTPGDISGDGVHPTDTGHAVIANQVLNYFHLYGVLPPLQPSSGTPVTGSGTTNFLSKFSSANGITNSSVTDDGSKVTITDPALEIAASATAGTTWNRTGGPTNEKIWDQYTDGTNFYNRVINDARGASTIWQQVVRSGTSITSITLPSGSFNVTNATNLTGALTTSTSITSNATAFIPVHFNSTSSNGSGFDFQRSGTTKAYIGSGVSGGTGGSTADDLGIRANNIFLSDLTNGNSKISFDALNGKAHIGSTTDQGAFTLQNTGGLYQNGSFSLRGTLAAPSGGLPMLIKGTDSVVYQIAQSSLTGVPNIYNADGTVGANRTVTQSSHWIDFSGEIYNNHLYGNGTAPSITAGIGAGTSPTVSVSGTDEAGIITIVPGVGGSTSAALVTITYHNTYAAKPVVVITPANSASGILVAGIMPYINDTNCDATKFEFDTGTSALTAATTYKFYYHVIGYDTSQ